MIWEMTPRLWLGAWLLCATGLAPSTAWADDTSSKAVRPQARADVCFVPDQTYRVVAGKELMLDLAYPRSGAGPCPTVVIIHGTGLLTGGRKANVPLVLELARAGYAAAAVSYRHNPTDAFPAALDDLECALRWLRANAAKYRINRARVAALGFSGGGSLACLLGMAAPPDGREAKGRAAGVSAPVQAVVSYFAPTDLARMHATAGLLLKSASIGDKLRGFYLQSTLEYWLGGAPAAVPDRYARASPITYANKDAAPLLLIHGTADTVVPVEQALLLARKLQEAGARASLLMVEQAPHDFDELHDTNARLAAAAARAFLEEHLKGPTGKK
jgi:acetyl esterase/lipase